MALEGDFRERELSWTQLLLDLKLAVGDGSLKFLEATGKDIRTMPSGNDAGSIRLIAANVLNNLPKSLQVNAKAKLHVI